MRNNIVALWMVHSETYQELMSESLSDAEALGIAIRYNPFSSHPFGADDGYELQLIKCTPNKISHGRVEQWRGWAVITWGFVEPWLLLNTVTAEESSIHSGLQSVLSLPEKQ